MTNRDWAEWQVNRIMKHRAEIKFPYDPDFARYALEALTFYRALAYREPEPFDLDANLSSWLNPPDDTTPEG